MSKWDGKWDVKWDGKLNYNVENAENAETVKDTELESVLKFYAEICPVGVKAKILARQAAEKIKGIRQDWQTACLELYGEFPEEKELVKGNLPNHKIVTAARTTGDNNAIGLWFSDGSCCTVPAESINSIEELNDGRDFILLFNNGNMIRFKHACGYFVNRELFDEAKKWLETVIESK